MEIELLRQSQPLTGKARASFSPAVEDACSPIFWLDLEMKAEVTYTVPYYGEPLFDFADHSMDVKRMYERENPFLCELHAEEHDCGEEALLPMVNSPRIGMCSYTG